MKQCSPPPIAKLKYQAWRRGTQENDLLLGPYADAFLPTMPPPKLALFTDFLAETDLDIFAWIVHKLTPPTLYKELVADIIKFHDKK